jgi:quercetin dioxygenase-like cupin family protein
MDDGMMADVESRRIAALFAIGLLEGSERQAALRRRRIDADFDSVVQQWQDRLAPLALAVPPVEPPADLWDRIAARLDTQAEQSVLDNGARTLTVLAEDQRWREMSPGVQCKILTRDGDGRGEAMLVRVAPGATLPAHPHRAMEECVILEGNVMTNGLLLEPGDLHRVPADTTHPAMVSPDGLLMFVRYYSSIGAIPASR